MKVTTASGSDDCNTKVSAYEINLFKLLQCGTQRLNHFVTVILFSGPLVRLNNSSVPVTKVFRVALGSIEAEMPVDKNEDFLHRICEGPYQSVIPSHLASAMPHSACQRDRAWLPRAFVRSLPALWSFWLQGLERVHQQEAPWQ